MKTETIDPKGSDHAKPQASPAPSPLRLTILLGVLVVFSGALVYDKAIAPPRVKAANEKLHDTILKHNEFALKPDPKNKGEQVGVKSAGMLYSADIQEILGMTPTKVEKHDLYTIEHYCWWGWVPRDGNYITVLYLGSPDKPHYSTHYVNMMPEDGVIPGKVSATPPEVAPADPSAAPAGAPPGMGLPGRGSPPMPGTEGGKGKGRPQNKGDKKSEEAREPESGAKKAGDQKTGEEPKKTSESADVNEPKTKAAAGSEEKESTKESAKESK
ncbi:MAG: hypothetical protein K8R36_11285 [Planctomycetales bacterium]|nr:hypothetical protein [Planctomycetales bacterium]